jgi:hypothetical protein
MKRAVSYGLAARIFKPGSPQALALLRAAWPLAVGPDLARRTELLAIERNTLRLRVPDARWRSVLHRMQPEILSRLRGVAGELAPARLGFTEGPGPARSTPEAPEPVAAAAAEDDSSPVAPPEVAGAADAIADPELRARFLASAARYLNRPRRG